jgi:hypothetical protein
VVVTWDEGSKLGANFHLGQWEDIEYYLGGNLCDNHMKYKPRDVTNLRSKYALSSVIFFVPPTSSDTFADKVNLQLHLQRPLKLHFLNAFEMFLEPLGYEYR